MGLTLESWESAECTSLSLSPSLYLSPPITSVALDPVWVLRGPHNCSLAWVHDPKDVSTTAEKIVVSLKTRFSHFVTSQFPESQI